jgi:hypothetical protein
MRAFLVSVRLVAACLHDGPHLFHSGRINHILTRPRETCSGGHPLRTHQTTSPTRWDHPQNIEHLAIGQTGMTPLIDQEDRSLLKSQVAMLQAAKAVVRRPEPNTVQSLRNAFAVVMNDTGWQGPPG